MVDDVTTVADLRVGQSGRVIDVRPGDGSGRRLGHFGIREGQVVTLHQRGAGGARVVDVWGSRVALDARTAAGIVVTVAGGPT